MTLSKPNTETILNQATIEIPMLSSLPQELFYFYILPNLAPIEKLLYDIAVEDTEETETIAGDLLHPIVDYAARGGHLNILKWARANGSPWYRHTAAYLAEGGHLEALKWVMTNGYRWKSNICEYAAKGDQLEVLEYARANDCPWDKDTCLAAVTAGNLDILKYLTESGCPWYNDSCDYAAEEGYLETYSLTLWTQTKKM